MPRCQLIRLLIPWFIHSRSACRRLLVFSPAPCLGRSQRQKHPAPHTAALFCSEFKEPCLCVCVCKRVCM